MQLLSEYTGTFSGKVNAPTFAYQTFYGKKPSRFISGREAVHKTRNINGIPIDYSIPQKAIKKLFSIKEIEARSSCQGESSRLLSFFIFRPKIQDIKYVKSLINNLNKQKNIKAKYDMGNGGLYRMCVTWKIWYGEDDFESWWDTLSKKIIKSLP